MENDNHERMRDLWRSSMARVAEMVAPLCGEDEDAAEEARDMIYEDALSVEVRNGWHVPGSEASRRADEYRICLTTGGPAVQITGDLDQWGEPVTAHLEVQDWFLPWTRFHQNESDTAALLAYAGCFYFGDGE